MPILTLAQHIALVREELLAFASTDYTFRDGYTGDPANSTNPNSISITSVINRAIAQINRDAHFNKTTQTISLVNGTREYSLNSGCFSILSAYIGDLRLRRTTPEYQDSQSYNWRSLTGTPKLYYTTSMNTIGMIPTPTASATLNLLVALDHTALAATTDTITTFPGPWQYMISTLASIYCGEIDAGNDKAQERVKYLQAQYNDSLQQLKTEIGARYVDEDQFPTFGRVQAQMAQDPTGGAN